MAKVYYAKARYWGRVTATQLGMSEPKSGEPKPQFVTTFTVVGQVNPADPTGDLIPCSSYDRSVFRTITEKTVEWLLREVDALCAAKGIEERPAAPSELAGYDFVGAELAFECDHNTYEGETREQWSVATAGGKPDVKPVEESGLRKLDAMFGKQFKAAAPKRAVSKPPVTQADNRELAAAGKDGIPF